MNEVLYTVSEVSKLIKCNTNYTYSLINKGLLPALKLGSMKVRRTALLEFLEKYEGKDLTDINQIVDLELNEQKEKHQGNRHFHDAM